jgi:hypothetical protein
VQAHGVFQASTYQFGESKAREIGARQDALRTVGTDRFEKHRQTMLEEVNQQAELKGLALDGDQAKLLRLAATTDLHDGVVRGLANQNPELAQQWLEKHQGEIEPTSARNLREHVQRGLAHGREAAIRTEGARAADWLARRTSQTDSTGVPIVDVSAALQQLEEAFTAGRVSIEVRDEAARRIEHAATVQQRARDTAVNKVVADAEAALTARPGMDPHDLPAPTLAVLVEHGKLPQLIAFANNGRYVNRNDALQEVAALTDSGQLASMTDEQFRKQFWGRLDNQTFERVDTRRKANRANILSPDQRIDNLLIEAGLLPAPGIKATDEQLQRTHRLKNEMDAQARARKIFDPKGLHELARQIVADAAYESIGSDELLPLAAMTPEERATAYLRTKAGDVQVSDLQALHPDLRSDINKKLRDAGLPVTDANVRRYVAELVQPRWRAGEEISAMPEIVQREAVAIVQRHGGDVTDPLQVAARLDEAIVRLIAQEYQAKLPPTPGPTAEQLQRIADIDAQLQRRGLPVTDTNRVLSAIVQEFRAWEAKEKERLAEVARQSEAASQERREKGPNR